MLGFGLLLGCNALEIILKSGHDHGLFHIKFMKPLTSSNIYELIKAYLNVLLDDDCYIRVLPIMLGSCLMLWVPIMFKIMLAYVYNV